MMLNEIESVSSEREVKFAKFVEFCAQLMLFLAERRSARQRLADKKIASWRARYLINL
jgi:hypothetical protein